MDDECTIGVETTTGTLDEATGLYAPEIAQPVYAGVCALMDARASAREFEAAGQVLMEREQILKLPIEGSEGVLKDMIVHFTSARFDSEHAGLRLRVTGPFHRTHATSRRLIVEEVQ